MAEISERERHGGLEEIDFFEISQTSAMEGGELFLVAIRERWWWRILPVVVGMCREREREDLGVGLEDFSFNKKNQTQPMFLICFQF